MHLLIPLFLFLAQASTIWDPARIHWQEQNADGSKYAVIEGDRSKPGPFTYAFLLPDGVWVPPHSHTGTARVFVVSGTLLLGDGPSLDKSTARAIPSGGVFLVPHDSPHWEGAKGETLIVGIGIGPWKTTYLERSALL
jgi:quercetin dioxygenase-like cupin family protein